MSWEPPFSTGTESAEPAGLRRLLGAPLQRLLLAAVAVGTAVVILTPQPKEQREVASFGEHAAPNAAITTPVDQSGLGSPLAIERYSPAPVRAGAGGNVLAEDADQTVYSIYLYKLPGLAPDATPGTLLDIWVTWKPPLTRAPKVDLLLEDVLLQRTETGFVEGPVADLVLDEEDVPRLIYGERFGSLNVTSSSSR